MMTVQKYSIIVLSVPSSTGRTPLRQRLVLASTVGEPWRGVIMTIPSKEEFLDFLGKASGLISDADCERIMACNPSDKASTLLVFEKLLKEYHYHYAELMPDTVVGKWLGECPFTQRAFQSLTKRWNRSTEDSMFNREANTLFVNLTYDYGKSTGNSTFFWERWKAADEKTLSSDLAEKLPTQIQRLTEQSIFHSGRYFSLAIALAYYEYQHVFSDDYIAAKLARRKKLDKIKAAWAQRVNTFSDLRLLHEELEDDLDSLIDHISGNVDISIQRAEQSVNRRINELEKGIDRASLIIKRNDETARERLFIGALYQHMKFSGLELKSKMAANLIDMEGIENPIDDVDAVLKTARLKWGKSNMSRRKRGELLEKIWRLTPPKLNESDINLIPT